MLRILSKSDIEQMPLFNEYINLCACPTHFAIASGALSFTNKDKLVCSNYFLDDTSEMDYSKVLRVNTEGNFEYTAKREKYYAGVRVAVDQKDLDERLILSTTPIDENISVVEYGYYPKGLLKDYWRNPGINIGESIKLPIPKSSYGTTDYEDFPIFNNEDGYYVTYRIEGLASSIDNEIFTRDSKVRFKIEPIRFWKDNKTGIMVSQDVIFGGVPFKSIDFGGEYDFYDCDADIYDALDILEEDVIKIHKIISQKEKQKVKK